MSNSDDAQWSGVIGPHGGYRNLKSYQNAEITPDATAMFCDRFVDKRSRPHDQMVQAARGFGIPSLPRRNSGLVEKSQSSDTSRETSSGATGWPIPGGGQPYGPPALQRFFRVVGRG